MHNSDFDYSIEEISKVEGSARVDLKIRKGKLKECRFAITHMMRFYTKAIEGMPYASIPQKVARICGTCSNAHILANVKAIENALDIIISPQTRLLRELVNWGLIIRDHGLHLYVFVMPDLFGKDSILDFDENNQDEHQLLHDCFDVKNAGNQLGKVVGGSSVHAPFIKIGEFLKIPSKENLKKLVPILKRVRPKVLRLIDVFMNCKFEFKEKLEFIALKNSNYSFLEGIITSSKGQKFSDNDYSHRITYANIPYSQAPGYTIGKHVYLVGALSRIILNSKSLHPKTLKDASGALSVFPSNNIFHNNLAQAIEILHAIDRSIDLINEYQEKQEDPIKIVPQYNTGYGIIEAPRGLLLHQMETGADGNIIRGDVVVPTGQNQISIEQSIHHLVEKNIDKEKDFLKQEIEKIIRAYDPCMSCATHFLKVNWN